MTHELSIVVRENVYAEDIFKAVGDTNNEYDSTVFHDEYKITFESYTVIRQVILIKITSRSIEFLRDIQNKIISKFGSTLKTDSENENGNQLP